MITRANELRHRLRFRVWCFVLGLRLRRHGGSLTVDAPHGARMDSFPHVSISGGSLTLIFGEGVKLGRATHFDVLGGENVLSAGDGAYLLHGVRLQFRGGSISLAAHVNLRDGVVLKSEGMLSIGYEVPVSYGCMIHCVESIVIEDRAGLAERVTVVDSDHSHYGDDRYFLANPLKIEPVVIGPNAFLCAGAVVTRGARVGANSVVAANAVVGAGDHPPGHLLAGAPARPIRELS